ncbi:MAG: phosphoribosylformylglycinamidine cyclo-ligase [Actinomycetota bacterium]|jgi:phosphoribosylformylglycinamidine cyclo-ligase|nr:phosphoribosylformylglycinamidine cyclo-ligase [Actinomycetota bacterium]|tara:strand:- start:2337 stop:3371 length:1035 start_codon:yes stop_codon:yes gene_type:complete
MTSEITYSGAGVDIDSADEAVRRLTPHVRSTFRPEVLSDIGGFGSVVAIPNGYQEPVLVSGNDGAGTKPLIAAALDQYDTIGIDVVAMCVDDIVTTGAEPLFFLDQITVGKVDPERIEQLVIGFAKGCRQAGCALTGGEIAEHPDIMDEDEFDLSGFAVGVAERAHIPSKSSVSKGDVLIGLASPGLRCNGYSLARRVFLDGRPLDQPAWAGANTSLGEELLRPSVIYAPAVLEVFAELDVHAAAHITGGGLPGNLARVIETNVAIRVDPTKWRTPEIFDRIAIEGPVSEGEMRKVFNLGIGMVLVVPSDQANETIEIVARHGHEAWVIGDVMAGTGQVKWSNE